MNRKLLLFYLLLLLTLPIIAQSQVPQWEQFETSFTLHTAKNPFTDVTLKATFTHAVSGKVITVDGFYDGSFSGQQPVGHTHDGSLHVTLEFRYQLYAIHEESLEEFLANISLVANKFAV
jgi:hypothetical protein